MSNAPSSEIHIELFERAEGTVGMRPVGLRPYVLLEVKNITDDDLTVAIEVGGGVSARTVEDLAVFLSGIADALAEYTVADDEEVPA